MRIAITWPLLAGTLALTPALTGALALALTPALAAAETVYLDVDFDDEPVDAPIATGGPAVGQPIDVLPPVTATVRATPMPTPCLEIEDNDDFSAGDVTFELIDHIELTTGIVAITCDLWFHEINTGYNFRIYIREQGSSNRIFGSVDFDERGEVWYWDQSGRSGMIGTYEVNRIFPVALIFDMDAGSCDIWIDDRHAVDDGEHGITDRGIGSVMIGCASDSDVEGRFSVDNLRVTDTFTPSPVTPTHWGWIKYLFRTSGERTPPL